MAGAASKGFLQPLYGLLERGPGPARGCRAARTIHPPGRSGSGIRGARGGPRSGGDARVPWNPGRISRRRRRFSGDVPAPARRADSIARPQALGAWLHGVARRIALKAKVAEARRKKHERRLAQRASPIRAAAADLGGRLHEELDRLPESLRDPVVLCYLEEMSYQSAARRLGLSEGTIRGRLVKARDRLRSRLAREGGIPEVAADAGAGQFERSRNRGALGALRSDNPRRRQEHGRKTWKYGSVGRRYRVDARRFVDDVRDPTKDRGYCRGGVRARHGRRERLRPGQQIRPGRSRFPRVRQARWHRPRSSEPRRKTK